jgi:hypothetical protein
LAPAKEFAKLLAPTPFDPVFGGLTGDLSFSQFFALFPLEKRAKIRLMGA